MWPKVFAQLVELLPHVSRLIPMADVFFASGTAGEKANEATLAALGALAHDVRGDLSGVTSSHEGLYRQLQEQSGRLGEVEIDLRRARISLEEQAVRAAELQKQLAVFSLWIKGAVGLLVVVIILLIVVLRSR